MPAMAIFRHMVLLTGADAAPRAVAVECWPVDSGDSDYATTISILVEQRSDQRLAHQSGKSNL